ncbi:MAG: hypothetical protein QME60_01405 [Verrucomicrobiota bacterium]|nr:hypothetical protein [Verrucomicrobiota bacterium]
MRLNMCGPWARQGWARVLIEQLERQEVPPRSQGSRKGFKGISLKNQETQEEML